MLNGIDLSYWQKDDYKALIDKNNPDFVIARGCWRFNVDSYCDKIIQYAKSKNKLLGVYAFPLTSDSTGKKHAEWFYQQILGYIGNSLIILDWERYSGSEGNLNPSRVDFALEWLKTMEELSGVKPLIYMDSSTNASFNFSDIAKNNNGLWIANYGRNDGKNHGYPQVKYWKFACMHQYTSYNHLDKNVFNGDKTAYLKYCKSNKMTPPKPNEGKNLSKDQIAEIEKATKIINDIIK